MLFANQTPWLMAPFPLCMSIPCRLAVLGVIVQGAVQLPGDLYNEPNHIKAFFQVGPQPLLQIFLFCGALESILNKGKMTALDMFEDSSRKPGKLI